MRIFSAFAIAASLAATPSMAQVVVVSPGGSDSARHEENADHQEHKAQRDDQHAHQDAAAGDYRGAAHEQANAQDHQVAAQHQ
jgi:hypothetical protein